MSKLTVTTIDTIDNVTDLTIRTGNTSGPTITVSSTDKTVNINASNFLINGSPAVASVADILALAIALG